jgi:hypothetical protein
LRLSFNAIPILTVITATALGPAVFFIIYSVGNSCKASIKLIFLCRIWAVGTLALLRGLSARIPEIGAEFAEYRRADSKSGLIGNTAYSSLPTKTTQRNSKVSPSGVYLLLCTVLQTCSRLSLAGNMEYVSQIAKVGPTLTVWGDSRLSNSGMRLSGNRRGLLALIMGSESMIVASHFSRFPFAPEGLSVGRDFDA